MSDEDLIKFMQPYLCTTLLELRIEELRELTWTGHSDIRGKLVMVEPSISITFAEIPWDTEDFVQPPYRVSPYDLTWEEAVEFVKTHKDGPLVPATDEDHRFDHLWKDVENSEKD